MRAGLREIQPLFIAWAMAFCFACSVLVYFWLTYAGFDKVSDFALTNTATITDPKAFTSHKVLAATSQKPLPAKPATQPAPIPKPASSSPGNRYAAGNCTWYAKSRRPDLPNNLGNAYSWVSRARAQGLPTGKDPKVGAIGQSGNHVVYVEEVHSNGTVAISEMNFVGYGKISHRTLPASSFTYIY